MNYFILITSSSDWQKNKWVMKFQSCSSSLSTGWSNNCFSAFGKHFLFSSMPSNLILLCLTHTPLPPSPSPSQCFNWLLSALSFVMKMTRPESNWHCVKIVSCDSCQAKSFLLYSSFRIKLETLSQSPTTSKKCNVFYYTWNLEC